MEGLGVMGRERRAGGDSAEVFSIAFVHTKKEQAQYKDSYGGGEEVEKCEANLCAEA